MCMDKLLLLEKVFGRACLVGLWRIKLVVGLVGWYTRFIPYVGLSVFRETAFCRMLGVAHPSLMVLVALVMVAVV